MKRLIAIPQHRSEYVCSYSVPTSCAAELLQDSSADLPRLNVLDAPIERCHRPHVPPDVMVGRAFAVFEKSQRD